MSPRPSKPKDHKGNTRSARQAPRGRARGTGKRGRPSKLSPDAIAQLENMIRAGATADVAATAAGISRGTFYRWLKTGEKARAGTQARDLFDRVGRARAESETVLVARIAGAANKGSWQAAAWLLERRFPERWMKPTERPLPDTPAQPEPAAADEDPFADVVSLAQRRRRDAR